jgi:ubiquinone biosynthesis protein
MHLTSLIRSRFRFAGNLARAAEVARVLAKYGVAGWLTEVEWARTHYTLKSDSGQVLAEQPFEVRFRLALIDLGTTFIKLGQVLSTRPDVVGPVLAEELSKLQEHTPPDPPQVIRAVVESELGRPIDECFMEFDGVASASASIGQVHHARLKGGRHVMVKVQHPGIEGKIRRDLDVLGYLAKITEKNERLRGYQPTAIVRQFSRTILNELDFRREMRNLQAFRRNFVDDSMVVFPRPYPELTTGRVLTMGRIRGIGLTNDKALDKLEVSRAEVARRGANIFVEMIFRDGFYHLDPHPGNFLVLPYGRIGLLDAGMVARIDDESRSLIADLMVEAGEQDAQRMADAVLRACGTPADLDRGALSTDLAEFFEECGAQPVGQFNVSGALTDITDILHKHKLILPSSLSMLIKCLIVLEGTSRLLSPKFNLSELLDPWRKKLTRQRFSLMTRLKHARRLLVEWGRLADATPKALSHLMDRLEEGRFTVHLELEHMKSAVNRLVGGLFMSALLLTSATLIARGVGPLVWGLSVVGTTGYVVAAVFGFHRIWVNRDKVVSRRHGDWE